MRRIANETLTAIAALATGLGTLFKGLGIGTLARWFYGRWRHRRNRRRGYEPPE